MEGRRIVAIYARVSTEHEAQISALENQVQYYDEILERHPNWILYKRYIDEGITGTSTRKRKNFMQMMMDAEDGKFDLIITREVSRFARNTVDTLQETRKLKKLGIEVWFTEDNIWTLNDEDGELRLTIMATLAQNESKKTSSRVKAGQKISFENGVPYGNGNILGYDKLPNHGGFVVNQEQAETVRMIYDWYDKGMGMKSICFKLEQEGRKTATGLTRWEAGNISRILNNPFYCGTIVYRKQFVPDYLEQKKINNFGDVEQVVVEGKHEPIITKEQFERIQTLLRSRTRKIDEVGRHKAVRTSNDVWCHKLRCSCGCSFSKVKYHKYVSKRTGETVQQYAYQCYSTKKYGSVQTRINKGLNTDECCQVKMIPRWKLEAMAYVLVQKLFLNKEAIKKLAEKLVEDSVSDASVFELHEELERASADLEKTKKRLDNLIELRLSDAISKDDFLSRKQILDEKIVTLTDKVETLTEETKNDENALRHKLNVLKLDIEKAYDFSNGNIPDEFIEEFVHSITVYKDYFVWKLNLGNGDDPRFRVEGRSDSSKVIPLKDEKLPLDYGCSTGCYRK